jgi:hypothetical protein
MRSRPAGVVLDEARMQHHVSVDQQDVVAVAGGDREIARPGDTESEVFLPDVAKRAREIDALPREQFGGGRPRSVVGDDDLVGQTRLGADAGQDQGQGVRPVVGGDDEGDAHASIVRAASEARLCGLRPSARRTAFRALPNRRPASWRNGR